MYVDVGNCLLRALVMKQRSGAACQWCRRRGRGCCGPVVHTERVKRLRQWRTRGWRMKAEAHCGEKGKSSHRSRAQSHREAGLDSNTEPLQSLCLQHFPFHPCNAAASGHKAHRHFWTSRVSERHHGAAVPRNGHEHTRSPRPKPLVWWQSAAQLVDHRR